MTVIKGRSPKEYFWLKWDGSEAASGALNQSDGPPQMSPPPIPVKLGKGQRNVRLVAPTGVSVRIGKLAAVLPADKALRIPIQLKNPLRARQLILRVYDRAGAVVYHERLDTAQVRALPRVSDDDLAKVKLSAKGPEGAALSLTDGPAPDPKPGFDRSPYRLEVWVTALDGAFTNLDAKVSRAQLLQAAAYEKVVHNEFVPTFAQVDAVYKRLAGDEWAEPAWQELVSKRQRDLDPLQTAANPKYQPRFVARASELPRLRVVMDQRSTGAGADRCVDSADARISSLRAALTAAEKKLNDEDAARGQKTPEPPERELRIFAAPEWFFRKANTGIPYTPKQMQELVNQLQKLSGEFPRWLLFPGTIWFAMGLAAPLALLKPIELKTALDDVLRTFKLTVGADTQPLSDRPEPPHPKAFLTANLGAVFTGGKLLHYVIKREAGEGAHDHEHFAAYWVPRARLNELCRSSFFTFQGLEFAFEVCRDHNTLRAVLEGTGKLADFEEKILRGQAGWFDELQRLIDDAEASLVHPHACHLDVHTRINALVRDHGGKKAAHKFMLEEIHKVFREHIALNEGDRVGVPEKVRGDNVKWLKGELEQWTGLGKSTKFKPLVDRLQKQVETSKATVLHGETKVLLAPLFACLRGDPTKLDQEVPAARAVAEGFATARANGRKAIGMSAPPDGVDVHFVVSNSVGNDKSSWYARKNGAFFKCDGESSANCIGTSVNRSDGAPKPPDATDPALKEWMADRRSDLITRWAMIVAEALGALAKLKTAQGKEGALEGAELKRRATLILNQAGATRDVVMKLREKVKAAVYQESRVGDGHVLESKGVPLAEGGLEAHVYADTIDLGPKAR